MDRWANRVALVTGASEGIGRATALLLANRGMQVVGCARNVARVEAAAAEVRATATGRIEAVQCDVGDEASVLAMFARIREKHKRLDVCVNNAGLGFASGLLALTTAQMRQMTDVNIIGLCVCTREAVKLMEEANIDDGHIIHVSSMSGHRVIPGNMGFYAATKHAVKALTESLRTELRDRKSNIRVSEISPGLVRTEFAPRSGSSSTYEGRPCLESQDIAEAIEFVLAAPQHVQIHDVLVRPTQQYS